MHKDERAMRIRGHRRQSLLFLVEFLDARKLRRADQAAREIVSPAMIAATQLGRMPAGLIDDLGGAMPAGVVEGTQRSVFIAHHQDRLGGNLGRQE